MLVCMGTRGGMVTAGTALVAGVLAFGAVQVVQAADSDVVVHTSDFGTESWDYGTVLAIRAAQDVTEPETAVQETGVVTVTDQPEPVEPVTTSPEPPSGDSWPGPPPVGAEPQPAQAPAETSPDDFSPGPPPPDAPIMPAPTALPEGYYDDTPPPPPVPNP
jgi:hypothetical protein